MDAIITSFTSDTYINPAETGFYYLNSRYYDPVVGRFLNADATAVLQLEQKDMMQKNLYAYCNNNPVNAIDSEGTIAVAVVLKIATVAIETGFGVASAYLEAEMNNEEFTVKDALMAGVTSAAGSLLGMTRLGKFAKGIDFAMSYVYNLYRGENKYAAAGSAAIDVAFGELFRSYKTAEKLEIQLKAIDKTMAVVRKDYSVVMVMAPYKFSVNGIKTLSTKREPDYIKVKNGKLMK